MAFLFVCPFQNAFIQKQKITNKKNILVHKKGRNNVSAVFKIALRMVKNHVTLAEQMQESN